MRSSECGISWRLPGKAVVLLALVSAPALLSAARSEAISGHDMLWVAASGKDGNGRLFLADTESGLIVRSFSAGHAPDILLSSDGTRLFVSAALRAPNSGATFEVIDTATGQVLKHLPDSDPSLPRGDDRPYRSRMALSADGSLAFRYTSRGNINVFDTNSGDLFPAVTALTLCGLATLVPATDANTLYVLCPDSEDLRIVSFRRSGTNIDGSVRIVPLGLRGRTSVVLPAFLSRDDTLKVIASNGSFAAVSRGAVIQRDAIDRAARHIEPPSMRPSSPRTELVPNAAGDWMGGRLVQDYPALTSSDRSLAFVRVGLPDEVVVLDATSLVRVRTIPLEGHYCALALGAGDRIFYAVDHEHSSIAVIDAGSGRVIKNIDRLGPGPSIVVVSR